MTHESALNVVFIGLGNMGLPMALNLVKAGHAVQGHDLSAAQVDALVSGGGRAGADLAHALAGADAVITMLPASAHVRACYLGQAGQPGVLQGARAGALLVDCSTIAPAATREVAAAAEARGFATIDAPVSGGTGGAQAGTLTFMVGGSEAAVERARPLLGCMGKNIFHAGPSGAGQTVKMCNNMLLAILMLATSEALQLGVANGVDAAVLSQIMAKSSGRNWALELYNPCPGVMPGVPASRGYSGGFGVDLMRKDLGLALESAQATNSSTPMGSLARALYDLYRQAEPGNGALDFSSVFRMFGHA